MVFEILYSDPEVQASLITSAGSILAALIAGIAAGLIGHQIAGRRRLQQALQLAVSDIHFLLAVEAAHCELHKEMSSESFKQRIRQTARDQGYEWTGRFTPGRARLLSLLTND